MSDKGSHGDGHPSNADTPLVVWGAGVKTPRPVTGDHSHCTSRFVDEHLHDTPTPKEWGLDKIEREDVNQADIAPLMSTLVGLPCPVNSVGNLPLGYIDFSEEAEVEDVLANTNTKQILNQFLRKSKIKESHSLFLKPFKPLAHYSSALDKIEELLSAKDYEGALKLSENLRNLALEGLHYFQTYDWMVLMTVITLGYIGWMVYLVVPVLQSYTSLPKNIIKKGQVVHTGKNKVHLCGCFLMGVSSILLLLERSPPLYHAYTAMTIFLWTQIFSEYHFLKALWKIACMRKSREVFNLLTACLVSLLILELLVYRFTERKLYTWYFLIAGQ